MKNYSALLLVSNGMSDCLKFFIRNIRLRPLHKALIYRSAIIFISHNISKLQIKSFLTLK
jgi:hypothetical protein